MRQSGMRGIVRDAAFVLCAALFLKAASELATAQVARPVLRLRIDDSELLSGGMLLLLDAARLSFGEWKGALSSSLVATLGLSVVLWLVRLVTTWAALGFEGIAFRRIGRALLLTFPLRVTFGSLLFLGALALARKSDAYHEPGNAVALGLVALLIGRSFAHAFETLTALHSLSSPSASLFAPLASALGALKARPLPLFGVTLGLTCLGATLSLTTYAAGLWALENKTEAAPLFFFLTLAGKIAVDLVYQRALASAAPSSERLDTPPRSI